MLNRKSMDNLSKNLDKSLAKLSFNVKERLKLYIKINAFVSEGISVFDAAVTMNNRYVEAKDYKRSITSEIVEKMDQGDSFSNGIKEWIPSQDAALIASGEASGNLSGALQELIAMTEKMDTLQKYVRSSVYPSIFLLVLLFAIIIMFSVFLVPQFKESIPEIYWTVATHSYFGFAEFVGNYYFAILIFFISLFVTYKLSVPTYTGKGRSLLDKLPGYSSYRLINSGYFLIALSAMMKSGTPFIECLRSIKTFMPRYIRHHIDIAITRVEDGGDPGEALNTGFIPHNVAIDLEDFGRLSGFAEGINVIGKMTLTDIMEKLKQMAAAIKTSVFAGIAAYLLWTAAALASAGFEMQRAAQMGAI
jgi:type II secretory pathway component PulF